MRTIKLFIFLLFALMTLAGNTVRGEVREYEYDISLKEVNFTGQTIQALVINDQIPAPTISATVGDTLRVTFNNQLDVETSVHWHGVLLPNSEDGVPYLTTAPIQPGRSHTFEFPITHAGTYWYHSHTGLQEQRGLYGSLVFHPRENPYRYDHESVIVISDWIDDSPRNVLRNLKREDDYYSLKKDTVQSWDKVIGHGSRAIKNRLKSAWIRMGPMDLSDVGYDAFLINGQQRSVLNQAGPGDTVRLRLINASASSYFIVNYSGGPLTLIEVDGLPVEPMTLDRLRLATAETFDVLIKIPPSGQYEFRATAEDASGHASLFTGEGQIHPAKALEKPNLFLMDHSMHGEMNHNAMKQDAHPGKGKDSMNHDRHHGGGKSGPHHDQAKPRELNEYEGIRSVNPTSLNPDLPLREVRLELTGSMERYVWTFNNKALTEADKILIRQGENVRFVFVNKTMMHHPLHLHGHFFRVLNGEGDHAPLKHTVNVPPMQTVSIEFYANEEKDWFFHCHNLYHMNSGMARVIRYADHPGDSADFDAYMKRKGDPWYFFADLSAQTQMFAGRVWAMNLRNTLEVHYDYDWNEDYDVDALYERHLTRYLGLIAGGNFETEDGKAEETAVIGARYVLPFLIESELRFDSEGQTRFQLKSDLQLTNRLNLEWFWNTDDEYRLTLGYEINKSLSLVSSYDSDFNGGIGILMHF